MISFFVLNSCPFVSFGNKNASFVVPKTVTFSLFSFDCSAVQSDWCFLLLQCISDLLLLIVKLQILDLHPPTKQSLVRPNHRLLFKLF